MASTWSALKVELQATGDNPGSWGTLTNANLGDAVLGEAITGSATVDFPSAADVTITLTDVATTQSARNLRLNITESGAGIGYVGNLILGSGCQIEKFYLVRNNGTGAKTIKNTTGTGISVPAGKATLVYNDGTNVVDVLNSFSSAILGAVNAGSIIPFYFANQAAFPSASTYHGAIAHSHADGAMYFAHSSAWVRMLDTGGPLGTPSSGTATNLTGLPLSTGVTGTLPIANGGTGTTSTTFANLTTNVTGILPVANGGTATATPALVAGTGVTISGTWPNQTINATGTGGTVTSVAGTGTVSGLTLTGTVTSSGSLTLGGTLSVTNANTTATSANTASAIVARDASGNFSAGTITATLSGNASTATSATSATTATTATTANATATANNFQMNSLGVGTAGSGTAGEIRATNNVTAYYSSDIKFKENVRDIPDALATVNAIGGKLFDWKDDYIESKGGEDGYFVQKADFGVVAQDVQKVFPIAVRTREDGSLAVDYEKLGALAFAALVELTKRVEALESK